MQVENMALDALIPYARNSRTHSDAQVSQIAASIREFGFTSPVLVDAQGGIIAGHGRVMAARKLGLSDVPCIRLGHLTDTQKRAYIIADNKLALNAGWDEELLKLEFQDLSELDFDIELTGFTLDEISALDADDLQQDTQEKTGELLTDSFLFAPFSILDTRRGEWLERKRFWKGQIQDNGESRENRLFTSSGDDVSNKLQDFAGVSILDPVMAELMTMWFGTKGGTSFDPFAGDSVFGYVNSKLGMKFHGIELRKEQCEINQKKVSGACLDAVYFNDTSENMDEYIKDESIDLVFSCPPYADLEVYSDDTRDLSNMVHSEFFKVYESILQKTYKKLKNNRFCVIVIGEVRSKNGSYIGIVPKTIEIMERAGYAFYNEIILINSVGTLALRAARQMRASRKIGKMHQNILVFSKGSPTKASVDLGEIAISTAESSYE